jgi:CspA family cold shock protein
MSKLVGKVKWFSPEKGFGFIEQDSGEDVFVSYESILTDGFKTLKKGQRVGFELKKDERGIKAINVEIV